MTTDFAYDRVTAIDEAKAVGETGILFAEIPACVALPENNTARALIAACNCSKGLNPMALAALIAPSATGAS